MFVYILMFTLMNINTYTQGLDRRLENKSVVKVQKS